MKVLTRKKVSDKITNEQVNKCVYVLLNQQHGFDLKVW